MSVSSSVPVRDAVILAAGNGDRFKSTHHHSKLLHPVLGQPLILRTLETAAAAGISTLNVVLGYEADRVRAVIEQHRIPGVIVRFAYNPDWHLENGVSALAARGLCGDRRFALLMGDHLFHAPVLEHLASLPVAADDSLLAIDTRPADPVIAEEATKVQLEGDRIVAIGKSLDRWDALDTGLFVFAPTLFDALEQARLSGETTLSAGVRRLAAQRVMRGIDVGASAWWDVDTVDDLESAEALFGVVEAESV